MILEFARLKEGTSRHKLTLAPSSLELRHDTIEFEQPVEADLTIDRNGDDLFVQGTVRHTARATCVRCLCEVDWPIEAPIQLVIKRVDDSQIDQKFEQWASSDDYLLWPRSQGGFDLSHRVRDVLLLELPMNPVCREDCRGLCSICGTNLNEAECGCDRDRPRGQLMKLKELLDGK